LLCTDCPVPFSIIVRGSEIAEFSKSQEKLETLTLLVLNAK